LAREQNLSLNPAKISGNCGRLLCCLRYEKQLYEKSLPLYPRLGGRFTTEKGEGVVEKINNLGFSPDFESMGSIFSKTRWRLESSVSKRFVLSSRAFRLSIEISS